MRITININDNVLTRITPTGMKVLRDTDQMWKLKHKTVNDDGYHNWQLWDLFVTFEGHIGNGFEPCFETTIELTKMKVE
jgi:hypothetical protein